jgi:hypothetical protein
MTQHVATPIRAAWESLELLDTGLKRSDPAPIYDFIKIGGQTVAIPLKTRFDPNTPTLYDHCELGQDEPPIPEALDALEEYEHMFEFGHGDAPIVEDPEPIDLIFTEQPYEIDLGPLFDTIKERTGCPVAYARIPLNNAEVEEYGGAMREQGYRLVDVVDSEASTSHVGATLEQVCRRHTPQSILISESPVLLGPERMYHTIWVRP